MDNEFERLEQAVERDMELLRALPPVALPPECAQRVQAAVRAEARRLRRRQRGWRLLRYAGGVAVAAALVLAVQLGFRGARPKALDADPETALQDWAAALDESTARLGTLAGEGPALALVYGEDESQLDDLFRSLDESLSSFEDL